MNTRALNTDRYRFRLALLHPRCWLTWLGLLAFFIITLLPMLTTDWLACRLGDFVASKNRKRFNIVKKNLTICFPEQNESEIESMVGEHFRVQYRSLMHYFLLWWRPASIVRKKLSMTGFDKVAKYQSEGKNIIIMLVHSVGLEFAVTAVTLEQEINGPFKSMRNPVIDWLVAKGRMRFGQKHGVQLFTREDGLRPLIRETRAGKVLVYLADEDLGRKASIFVPFYGVQKATIPVLGRLAKSCDAVVLPCVSCYDAANKRYSITLLPAIKDIPSGDDEKDTLAMNRAIEQVIDFCPVQYLWTLRYFKTRPMGEPSIYE
ncbi:MAG: hypothetical protein JKX75_10335 [Gammaproteobacteria bacterium]|nr:hypothetical protein [Gammaproteobacteria bacterium]